MLAALAGAQWIRPADLLKAQPKTSTGTTRVKIDAEQIVSRVNPMIFGQFIEHLGRCIYGGIYEEGSPLSDAQGFRKDVLEAVRRLNPPVIRWPGGNFASSYHWEDGVGPKDLNLASLVERVAADRIKEVILAINATVDGQTTAHYIVGLLADSKVKITRLAHGIPVGGELDYLDEGTLAAAINSRTVF